MFPKMVPILLPIGKLYEYGGGSANAQAQIESIDTLNHSRSHSLRLTRTCEGINCYCPRKVQASLPKLRLLERA